jgi:hypothetical protein
MRSKSKPYLVPPEKKLKMNNKFKEKNKLKKLI